MQLLRKLEINDYLDRADGQLSIDPLLDRELQVGEVALDLRLGYDFLVSVLTRNSAIDLTITDKGGHGIATHYHSTRRNFGDVFVLHPGQVVIGTTLEYVALPGNLVMEISARSSYSRLGVGVHSFTQPGYRGCISIELFNHGNVPIKLTVGSRIVQARIYDIGGNSSYAPLDRKYFACVRPVLSRASHDPELSKIRSTLIE